MATAKVAKTAPTMTWQDRALALMEQKRREHDGIAWRNSHIVAWYPDGTPAEVELQVESLSSADAWHTVTYYVNEDAARCDCIAGSYTRPCCHSGVAIKQGRYVAAQYTREARAESRRMFWLDLAAIDNSRVLGY